MTTSQIKGELANSHLNATARKIWTEALAQPEFAKVQVIWAWGNGPDHNNGRCCDFMITIPGVPRDEQVRIGDAIRAYFVKHAKRLHVEGIIWNRHVTGFPSQGSAYRGPEGTARPYSGASTHTDHNHVQVSGKTPTSWLKSGAAESTPAKPTPPKAYPKPKSKVIYLDKVKPGVRSSDSVYWVQVALARVVAADLAPKLTGTYDKATKAAASAFQASLGDDVDGDLGQLQTNALLSKAGLEIRVEEHS